MLFDILYFLIVVSLGWFVFGRKLEKSNRMFTSIGLSFISWFFYKLIFRTMHYYQKYTETESFLYGSLVGIIVLIFGWMVQNKTFNKGAKQQDESIIHEESHNKIIGNLHIINALRNSLVPLLIITILLGLYFARWEQETTFKPSESIQVMYKTDRWTGERWISIYAPMSLKDNKTSGERPDKATKEERDVAKRKHDLLSNLWTGLFSLSIVWLFLTLIFRRPKNI